MFDTMIYDEIQEHDLRGDLLWLKTRGIEYVITHVQVDEVSAISDRKLETRQKLILLIVSLRPKMIATKGVILGVSRFGYAQFASKEESSAADTIRKEDKNLNPSKDALIGVTALSSVDIYVTNDKERRPIIERMIQANELDVKLMTFDQFHEWVKQQLTDN
jgi:hypothetical protein